MVTFFNGDIFMSYSLKVLFLTLKIYSRMAFGAFVNFNGMLKCALKLRLCGSPFSLRATEAEQPRILQVIVLTQIVGHSMV